MRRLKCLITGFNANQCTRKFYLRQQLRVVPSHYSLYNCLVDMGHEVEQRKVVIGEDLSQYDEVIVFIAGPRQLVATCVYNGLWAISQHPRCILAYDDWQVSDLFKGVLKCATGRKELFAQFILDVNKTTVEEMLPYESAFTAAISTIAEMKNRMLISAFRTEHLEDSESFGPHLLFDKVAYPRDRMFVYNPNPYHRNRKPGDLGNEGAEDPEWGSELVSDPGAVPVKERRFNFASLVQSKTKKWLKKQGYQPAAEDDESGVISFDGKSWPTELYGSKAESQKRLTEDQMCDTIAGDWGCLMPGYDHAGSGWWRARPLQCADAGSILIGEPKEMAVYYGKDFPLLDLRAADLLVMDDSQLADIAEQQKQALYRLHPLDKSVQQAELNAALGAKR
jgi:hypothetical protein